MPYKVKKVKGGYKVYSPNGAKSKKPLSKAKALAQERAIYANTNEDLSKMSMPKYRKARKGGKK